MTDSTATHDIVFIDSRVQDAATLLQGLQPGTQVVYLDASQDGLAQMAAALGERGDVGSVQVIAHGSAGQLWLGSTFLDNTALQRPEVQAQLAALGQGLTADGDLLVYACNTAQGSEGAQFVSALAALTGADVAASSNRTGAGGDWDLEVSTGTIDRTPVFSALGEAAYQYNLATLTVTSNADTGVGTLRNAIAGAITGDTITFSSGMTVGLTTGQLVINKGITIDGDLNNDGVADVTLDANYHSRVLQVQAGSNVMLDGLVITRGLVSGDGGDAGSGLAAANAFGGGIWNAGTLTLLNTSVTANAAAGGGGGGGNFAYDGGGGGGGGALGGGIGGRGGESGVSNNLGGSGSANQGGHGGADSAFPGMGGQGGTGVGGAGGSYLGYSTGGTGGTATNGSISIGGGGGGLGTDATGGAGGSAAGGIYNAVGGTINVIGNSIINNNLGAGGGGGGGGAGGSLGNQNGGAGGRGVGAVWNKGIFNITTANNAAMTNNGAGSGAGGQELGTGSPGPSPAAVTGIYNDGGALNTSYVPNAPPVLGGLQGDSVTFTEGDSARLIDLGSNATVSDGDSADFNGGSVRVSITTNRVTAEDLLSIRNQGTGAGQIGVSGSTITYGGVAIGTFTGGSGSNDLLITFNSASATPAAVEALLHNLVYDNSNVDNPTASARTLSVTVYDGDSYTTTTTNTVTVTVVAVNDAPTLSPANSNASYTEGGSAAVLSSSLTLADVDSTTFQGATVTVSDFRAGDVLSVGAPNGFTVSYDSGTGVLTLSGGGSQAALQAALRSVTYSSSSDDPTAGGSDTTRQINFTVTDSGGATSTAVTAQVTVTGVNDAPTLSGGPYTWAGTNEDTTSSAVTVATLLGSTTHADPDGPAGGIAITGSSGGGTWEYSTDGVNWTGVGTVSNNSALLLSSTTQLHFVPDGANGSAAGLTFRAWDQSFGTASTNGTRMTADTSTNGGSAAYSSGTAQATLTVSSVNDAPVLTPVGPTLTGLTDSDTNNLGVAVSSFLSGHVTDADTSAVQGIALTGLTSGTGTWQYSTNGGASWQNVGAVSDASALLLRSGDRVRFVPDGINGDNVSLTYHAWDQSGATVGQQGTKVDASATGGANPFSTATDTATLAVTAIDDAPVITTSGGAATFVEGNNVTSTPVVIDSGLTVSDSDSPQLSSATVAISGNFLGSQDVLAFTNNPATMGDIVASYDSGTGILTLTSAAGASAAQWQAALRSVTYSNSSDTPSSLDRTITFKVNDGNSDSSGTDRTVTVAATNDAPTVSMPASLTAAEDTATAITGISFADADAGSASVTVTLSVGSGTLSATSGGGVTIGGTASALTLSGSIANINAFITGGAVQFLGAANSTTSVTLTASIDDGGQSGGAAQTGSGTVTIAITPVNDAPHVSAPSSIAVTEDVTSALSGISFSDVDASLGTVSVQFSVVPGSGTLSATDASGVTVLGSGTDTLSLSGTLSDINAFVTGGAVGYTTAANATGNVVLDVTIDDGGNTGSGGSQTDHTTVTLTITAVNDAPVNSVPGTQSVLQDGTLMFSTGNGNALSIADVDVGGGTMRVTLTASNGLLTLGSLSGVSFLVGSGTGDGTMVLEGTLSDINNALAGLSFAPTGGYYGPASVQITTDDLGQSGSGGGQTDTDTILINVAQPNPSITGVASSSANGAYKMGDTVHITITYDQAVTVSGGVPTLLLETGANDRLAVYVSGSGTNTLTFAYVVQAGDHSTDLDYVGSAALSLNGASIASVSLGNPAFTALPTPGAADSLSTNAAIVIDGVAPTITSVDVPTAATYTLGQTLDFTVNFAEAVAVDTTGGTPRLTIALDTGGTAYANYISGSGTTSLVFQMVVASGQVDLTGITVGALQAHGGVLRDQAGNNAELGLHGIAATNGVKIDAPAPPQPPAPQPPAPEPPSPQPPSPPVIIDGTTVTTTPGTGGTVITTIPVITSNRPEDPSTPNSELADIPVLSAPDGKPILEVGLPIGVGVVAEGLPTGSSGEAALAELGLRIQRINAQTGQDNSLVNSGETFFATMDPNEALFVQAITLTSGTGFNPAVPIIVHGSTRPEDGKQAIILDARGLPSGSVIQIDNVDFIAVAGNVRLIGGAGQNMAAGDGAAQWMVQGADDDVLHGGGGNDTVGSLGGNDQIFGDAGDDIVFGGSGNDTLSGGTGNDRLDGGLGWDRALQSGSLQDYALSREGDSLVLTHKGTGEVDHFKSVEMIRFDNGSSLYVAASNAEAALAHIVTRWLHRDLTPAEGAEGQLNSHLSALEIAQAVLRGPFAAQLQGHSAEELIAGWQNNPQIVRMNVTPELVQGGSGLDTLTYGFQSTELHLQRLGDGHWEGTHLGSGAMADLQSIERLHFQDVSVALDTEGAAGTVAALLAVTLGAQGLSNRVWAGEGLAALDFGMQAQDIGEAAMRQVQAQQGHTFTAQETVQWLWSHAMGSAGTAQQLQPFVDLLTNGQMTVGELAGAAAKRLLEQPTVELVGVLEQGLMYTPM
ncbi:DUF4347 domain-containing protein [Comamonas sp. Y6]|uniref:DUF4347 domain-containing protein n=1 Tax=Comamonas resistens TaxID=3046670 RepID=A0ABY8SLZ0_9BURK|nr:DUF4347 domain-containing protein [Comamonas resistens]MDL5038615.1 DUF4347 domain-containing protein [Comamonas resistens]WHS64097.1 DUF4347 domain-containing protein [Comamonas resistens]